VGLGRELVSAGIDVASQLATKAGTAAPILPPRRYRPAADSAAFWMAKASDSVIGDLPVSFRQSVE
jgi:hypothetical protein